MRGPARQPIRDTRRSGAESKRRRGPRLPAPPSRVTLGRPYAAQDGLEGLELELLRRLRLHFQLELQARRIRRAHDGCAEPPDLIEGPTEGKRAHSVGRAVHVAGHRPVVEGGGYSVRAGDMKLA